MALRPSDIPPACFIQDTPDDLPPPTPGALMVSVAVALFFLYLACR